MQIMCVIYITAATCHFYEDFDLKDFYSDIISCYGCNSRTAAFVNMRMGAQYTNKPSQWEYTIGRDCCWQGFMTDEGCIWHSLFSGEI